MALSIKEIYLDIVDSTNTYAKIHGASFAPNEVTCIIAEEQTGGKGQFQKKWNSPPRVNLYVTFYFHLPNPTQNLSSLAILMAKSIKTVLDREGFHATLKWPNDVQVSGKKIGGALCETIFHPKHIEIILGFGLNINMEDRELAAIDQPATSLKNETNRTWDKKEILKKIQTQFLHDLEQFRGNF